MRDSGDGRTFSQAYRIGRGAPATTELREVRGSHGRAAGKVVKSRRGVSDTRPGLGRPDLRRPNGRTRWVIAPLAIVLSGCDFLVGDNALTLFALVLVGTGALGGAGMFLSFLRRFRRWNLDAGEAPERFGRDGWILAGLLIAAVIVFGLYNSSVDTSSDQLWQNCLAWLIGSAGGIVGYLGGRRLGLQAFDRKAVSDGKDPAKLPPPKPEKS